MTAANLFEPEFEHEDDPLGYAHRRARLGVHAGAEHLGASLYELDPGVAVCPYRWHAAEEERLVVMAGEPSLRTPEGWRDLRPGEVARFPVGSAGAHQIVNRGAEAALVLLLSQRKDPEVCGYPDSRKVMADA